MVSLVLPQVRAGTSKRQRSHARLSPLGQPQLNVPRKESHPRGKPLQPRFPKEHHHRRAADDSLCVTRPQSEYRLQPGKKKGVVGKTGVGSLSFACSSSDLGKNQRDHPELSLGLLESPFSMFHNMGLCSRPGGDPI